MYGLDGSYRCFTAFVSGCDAGNSRCLLIGFREWLITKVGEGDNLIWESLVLRLTFPEKDRSPQVSSLSSEENALASATCFRLLDEFFQEREQVGNAKIFDNYLNWLKQQTWHQNPGHNEPDTQ
jgi:hypothetical protein